MSLQGHDVLGPGAAKLVQRERDGVPPPGFRLTQVAWRQHGTNRLAEVALTADDVQQERAWFLQAVANVDPTVVVEGERAVGLESSVVRGANRARIFV